MRNVPWWGVLSSAAAPVLLAGGWTIAATLQPPSFDPVTDTVSALAAVGAVSRWLMTATFLAVGTCDVITGLALRPASAAGRLILAAGAAVGMLVAAYPQQADGGGSLPHAIWASAGFTALAVWPAGTWRRGPGVPWGLRPAVCAGAVAVLVCLLAWFAAEVVTGAGQAGLAEGVLGLAQAVWPLTVVLSSRHPVGTPRARPHTRPETAAAQAECDPAVTLLRPVKSWRTALAAKPARSMHGIGGRRLP